MRTLRILFRIALVLLLLLMATAGALHIPRVQRWAVERVVNGVSEDWGVRIGLEGIRFPWWRLALRLEGLEVYDVTSPEAPPMLALEALELQGWEFDALHGALGTLELGPGEVHLTPLLAWWGRLPADDGGEPLEWGLKWGQIGITDLVWTIAEPEVQLRGMLETLRVEDLAFKGEAWSLNVPELGLRWEEGFWLDSTARRSIPQGAGDVRGVELASDADGLNWRLEVMRLGAGLGTEFAGQGRWDWQQGAVQGGVIGSIAASPNPTGIWQPWIKAAGVPALWEEAIDDALRAGWSWDVAWTQGKQGGEAQLNQLAWGNRLALLDTAQVTWRDTGEVGDGDADLPGLALFSSLPEVRASWNLRWAGLLETARTLPSEAMPADWEATLAPLLQQGPDAMLQIEKDRRRGQVLLSSSRRDGPEIQMVVAPGTQHWDATLTVNRVPVEQWMELPTPLPLKAELRARLMDFEAEGWPRNCTWELEAHCASADWDQLGHWEAHGNWEAGRASDGTDGAARFPGKWSGEWVSEGGNWPMREQFTWEPGDDGDWELRIEGVWDGIEPASGKAWKLVAHNDLELRRNSQGDYRFKAGLRNALLLDGGVPRMISRFDLFGSWNGDIAEARWESDLTQGNLRTSTDVEHWTAWLENQRTRSESHVAVPVFATSFSLRRFEPVAAVLQLPLNLADGTAVQARLGERGITARIESDEVGWEAFTAEEVFIELDGTAYELFGTVQTQRISQSGASLLTDLAIDIHADSTWKIDLAWAGWDDEPLMIRSEVSSVGEDWWVDLYEATVPLGGEQLVLSDVPACMSWTPSVAGWRGRLENFRWEGEGIAIELEGSLGPESHDAVKLWVQSDHMPDLSRWGVPALVWRELKCEAEVCAPLGDWSLRADAEVLDGEVGGARLEKLKAGWEGNLNGGSVWVSAHDGGRERVEVSGRTPFDSEAPLRLRAQLRDLPLAWTALVVDPAELALSGGLSGRVDITGTYADPVLRGRLAANGATARIGYLGTTFGLQGALVLDPDFIGLDNWVFTDDQGHRAVLTGTLLHTQFEKWSYDVSLDLGKEPMHLMELTRKDNDFFFGTAYATGDLNVFGYGDRLNIDARLRTEPGTVFALPLDGAIDATYADFIQFRSPQVDSVEQQVANPTRIRLNLALDITEAATARIIFDEAVGDEISGQVRGALNLNIDDFERFAMTGGLEVVQGSYLFTLQNVINKKFVVDPGGTITWFGDPYAAEIDLDTRYRVRTRLQELLPNETGLPGRMDVDLVLGLQGNLLRPDIGFEIKVPQADTRIQALVESALINEEELNRQAISLLVLQQFLSPDPTTAAIGTTGLQERSTDFLAAQVGNWLSQASNDLDVGLDYGADAVSGEQALAVALSTRLLDDRLQIEGAVGTQRLTGGNTQDFQVQDVRVSYDLKPGGAFQVTGYTQMNPIIPGQEGTSTQGVGVRFRKEFAYFRDIFRQRRNTQGDGDAPVGDPPSKGDVPEQGIPPSGTQPESDPEPDSEPTPER